MQYQVIQDVHCSNDFLDSPDKAVITVTEQDARRILKAHEILVQKEYASIEDWDASVEYKSIDYDSEDEALKDWDGTTEAERVVISSDFVRYTALVRHTEVELCVDGFYVEELKEALEISEASPEQLLKWVNREWSHERVKEYFNKQFSENVPSK